MATLTVVEFPTPYGADQALEVLQAGGAPGGGGLHDATVVSWPPGAKQPRARPAPDMAEAPLGLVFWDVLLGLIFFVPFSGATAAPGAGDVSGALAEVGIDSGFVDSVRREVVPGTSALFVVTGARVETGLRRAFRGRNMAIVSTDLSSEQLERLRQAFATAGGPHLTEANL